MVAASPSKVPDGPVGLEEILITGQLNEAHTSSPSLSEEWQAFRRLARILATNPTISIDELLEIALQLCNAETSGLSVLETLPSGEQVFRWTNLAGRLKRFVGGSTPRHFSPCGVCLDRDSPQLFAYPARRFQYLSDAVDVPIVRALVIPVPLGLGAPATLWILAHKEGKNFDAEDVRIMVELSDFTGSALGLIHSLQNAERSRKVAEGEISQRRIMGVKLRATQRDLEESVKAQSEALKQAETEVATRRRSEEELQKGHNALEIIVGSRTTQLRQLSAKLQVLQDEERRRIARELHDSAGQYLSAIKMSLSACLHDEPSTWTSRVTDSLELTDRCLTEIRTISYLLHPPLLDEVGLLSALSWFTEGFSERSGIHVQLKAPPDLSRLPSEVGMAIFRVVQQALSNIHRHSGSKIARINMAADAGQVMLEICDEGCGIPTNILNGFETGTRLPGVGIAGMRERISNIGGKFSIRSSGHGTTIKMILPVSGNNSHQHQGGPTLAGR